MYVCVHRKQEADMILGREEWCCRKPLHDVEMVLGRGGAMLQVWKNHLSRCDLFRGNLNAERAQPA